jgi:hypothetical protein
VKEQKRQWRGNNLLTDSKTRAFTQEHNACKSRRRSQSVANDISSGVSTHEDAPNIAHEDTAMDYKVFCCTTGNCVCRSTRSAGFLTYIGPRIVTYSYSNTNQMHLFLKLFIFVKYCTCFGWSFRQSSEAQDCTRRAPSRSR